MYIHKRLCSFPVVSKNVQLFALRFKTQPKKNLLPKIKEVLYKKKINGYNTITDDSISCAARTYL